MTVEGVLCDQVATWLHKKTYKYSFMTRTCQAEDDCLIVRGIQWFTLWNLIGANPYIIHNHLSIYLRVLSVKWCVSTAMFQFFQFSLFQFNFFGNSTSIYNHSIASPAPKLHFGYVQICIESRVMIY